MENADDRLRSRAFSEQLYITRHMRPSRDVLHLGNMEHSTHVGAHYVSKGTLFDGTLHQCNQGSMTDCCVFLCVGKQYPLHLRINCVLASAGSASELLKYFAESYSLPPLA